MPGISPLESLVGVQWHAAGPNPAWSLEFAARVVDNQERVAKSLLEIPTPGFTTFDWRAYWEVTSDLFLIGGVENIFDRAYREHLDFRNLDGISLYQPGRVIYLGGQLSY